MELEEEAFKRKQRLLELRKHQKRKDFGASISSDDSDKQQHLDDEDEETPLKKAVFRSYNPIHHSLQMGSLPKPQPVDVEEHIEEQLEASQYSSVMEEMDLSTLAPRKIDWDLKRDVERKLQKLERRTQRAIAELIRERLAAGKDELFISAVNSSIAAQQGHDSDED